MILYIFRYIHTFYCLVVFLQMNCYYYYYYYYYTR